MASSPQRLGDRAAASGMLATLPDSVSFSEAAPLPVVCLADFRALLASGPLRARRRLATSAGGRQKPPD